MDKNRTWVEGRAQYDQLSLEPEARIPSNSHSSQVKSSPTEIYSWANKWPQADRSLSPEIQCRRDVNTICANPTISFGKRGGATQHPSPLGEKSLPHRPREKCGRLALWGRTRHFPSLTSTQHSQGRTSPSIQSCTPCDLRCGFGLWKTFFRRISAKDLAEVVGVGQTGVCQSEVGILVDCSPRAPDAFFDPRRSYLYLRLD